MANLLTQAREKLSQQLSWRTDLAVTGLRRSGKSVFITSSIQNLLSVAHNPGALRRLGTAARIQGASELAQAPDDLPQFRTADYLRALAAEDPIWPPPTEAVSRAEVVIRYERQSFARHLSREGRLNLGFIDYPGEWLLDLPMVAQSYADWSAATMDLLRAEPRRSVAKDFIDFEAECDPTVPADPDRIARGYALYCEVLHRARDELFLSFLQPGRFVMPDAGSGLPPPQFFPMQPQSAAMPKAGSLGALMAERFSYYTRRIVKPFFADTFARTNRQVVLVDLITALNNGRHAFDDTCRALGAALSALQVQQPGLLGKVLPLKFDRILFAVTKADHAPDAQRDRLCNLLASVTGLQASSAVVAGAKAMCLDLASARCTVDEHVRLDIGNVDVVVGTPVGKTTRVKLYPGTIPREAPPASFWDDRRVEFPIFKPPPLSALPGRGIPHINLDIALNFLLGDLMK